MAIRLTNDMRSTIQDAIISHRFLKEVQDLEGAVASLSFDVYKEVLGVSDRARIDLMPAGWLPTTGYVSVRFGADYTTLQFSGDVSGRKKVHFGDLNAEAGTVYRRTPENLRGTCWASYDAGHPLSIRYEALDAALLKTSETVQDARRQVYATLQKFTTMEKLIEGWPEVEPFTVGVGPAPKSTAVAVPVKELNGLLGLPV